MLATICALLAQSQAQPTSQDGKKEIPKITFKNLSPPYKDYDYFQDSKKYAFQFSATSFNLINAWWLAEASTLAYAGEDFVRSRFEGAGLPEVKFFENQSTQCYIANNDKFAIVAFRGSEIWKKRESFDLNGVIADLKTNNDDIVPRVPPRGAYVHVGELKFIDGDGIIRDTMIENEPPVNQPRDEIYGRENTNPSKKNSFAGFVPAVARDHVPLLYAIHLWNNIIENRK
jgi:hypothetical protein